LVRNKCVYFLKLHYFTRRTISFFWLTYRVLKSSGRNESEELVTYITVCVCVCMYVSTDARMCVCMYMYVCVHVCMYVCMSIYVCMYDICMYGYTIYVCIYVCTYYVYVCICTCVYIYVCMYVCMSIYVCMYVRVCVCMYVCKYVYYYGTNYMQYGPSWVAKVPSASQEILRNLLNTTVNYLTGGNRIMRFLMMRFPPVCCSVFLLKPKYLCQHPFLDTVSFP